jgi:hypothetical protein
MLWGRDLKLLFGSVTSLDFIQLNRRQKQKNKEKERKKGHRAG